MSSYVARGLCVRDIPGGPMGLAEVLDAVVAHGCDGVQLPSLTWLSSTLDPSALRLAAQSARDRGVVLSSRVGVLNPARPERSRSVYGVRVEEFVSLHRSSLSAPSSDGPTEQQRWETGLRAPAFALAPR